METDEHHSVIEQWDVTSCPFCGYTGEENTKANPEQDIYFCVFCHSLYQPGKVIHVKLIHDSTLQEKKED